MAIARPILGFIAILLLAGGIVMQFLVILSGLNDDPENQVYFLQTSTNGISGGDGNLRNPIRWTYLRLCGVDGSGHNANCDGTTAALPFSPAKNFGSGATGVPSQFIGTHHYYYLSRFAWVFYLIALFFAVVAIFTSLAALCARLGAYLTGTFTFLAWFFQTLAASLMTAWTVQGRNVFRSAGQTAQVGTKAYAFSWASFACFFLATILFCVGGSVGRNERYSSTSGGKSSFRRRGRRDRGSFIENESQRRVIKDETDTL